MKKEKFIKVPLVELPINAEGAKRIMLEKEFGIYLSIQKDTEGNRFYAFWSVYPTTKDGVSTKDAGNVWNMPQEVCEKQINKIGIL